jgi:hypothetical protein
MKIVFLWYIINYFLTYNNQITRSNNEEKWHESMFKDKFSSSPVYLRRAWRHQ